MKTIIAVILLIVAIVVIDHYDLLKTDSRFPEPVNQLIRKITDEPAPTPIEVQPQESLPVTKDLYQWKDDSGQWVVADTPPKDRPYKTITLSNEQNVNRITDNPAQASPDQFVDEQTLLKQSQCSYFMEQIDRYKKRGQFGGTSDQVDQWQQQIDSYQKQYFQNGCAEIITQ